MVKHAADTMEPLLTAEERVDRAVTKITAGRPLNDEQRRWMDRIRAHLITNLSISRMISTNCLFSNARAVGAVVLRKYDIRNFSSRDCFQFIFVVKAAEYGNCRHAMVIRNVMPSGLKRDLRK